MRLSAFSLLIAPFALRRDAARCGLASLVRTRTVRAQVIRFGAADGYSCSVSRRSDAWGDVTVDELLIGGSKALANAQDLLSDARLLLENSRIARAYALAQLAQEELGKIPMLYRIAAEIRTRDL